MITIETMKELWPHGDQHIPGLIEGIVNSSEEVFEKYGITSPLARAHFLGQVSHECGAGEEMIENMNYSQQGLINTWPSRFDHDRAARYAHNPMMIGDTVYGGRMGNLPPPSNDGYNFRGRGLTQLTGKGDYDKVGKALDLDLVSNPDLINDPAHILEIGAYDFVKVCGCLPYAEKDDIIGVTRHLDGGLIGLASRKLWTVKWKHALSV